MAGALARYGIERAWPSSPPSFPWTTLAINLAGCLLIGVLLVALLEGGLTASWLRPLLAVGLIGGFTTFSTFAVEALELVDAQAVRTAILYVVVSVLAGMCFVWLGSRSVRLARRRKRRGE